MRVDIEKKVRGICKKGFIDIYILELGLNFRVIIIENKIFVGD